MKQKVDKPDEKESWRERFFNPSVSEMIDAAVILFLVVAAIVCIIGIVMAEWEQQQSRRAVKAVPAEQRQPMIEIPIERTVCVKPAEGYCMEYRTNRIRTP